MGLQDKIMAGAVETVAGAYREVTGARWFKPKVTEKVTAACKEFVRVSFLLSKSVRELMTEAVGLYGKDWCRETFRKPYPPFTIVTGEKCRKRLIWNHRPRIGRTQEMVDAQAREMAENLLALMGREKAIDIVNAGWPVDVKLRAAVLQCLKVEA